MKDKTMNKETSDVKKAFLASIPVMAGYIVLGIGFGIILKTKGYGVIWAVLMSLFVYAGSMQYVLVNRLTSGASLIPTTLTTLMVNARHLFYGISMIDRYKGAGRKKPYLMFALTDETYSLVCSEESVKGVEDRYKYYFFLSLFNQSYWITGSLIGSVLGSLIPFSTEGIDFVLTALFVTIFVEQWLSVKDHRWAMTGVVCSAVCLLIFGSENFLIPAMICITAVLLALKNKAVRGKESGENEVRAKESRVDEQCTFDNDSGCRSSGYSRTQSSAISDFRWK